MTEICKKCAGVGMRMLSRPDGERYAVECECLQAKRAERLVARASIPRRYEDCSLESYEYRLPRTDPTQETAHLMATNFVHNYPAWTDGKGLLFTGPVGVGKTHLAVGILRGLMIGKGVQGLFCDYRELLKEIQHSYNPQIATTELQILAPVFDAEVLVIDELGAQKPTEWVWDTVALVLNTRYNKKRTTIITTNYTDQPAAIAAVTVAERAMQEESLAHRIGERMRSRLAEMCVTVEVRGDDFRQGVKRARFG